MSKGDVSQKEKSVMGVPVSAPIHPIPPDVESIGGYSRWNEPRANPVDRRSCCGDDLSRVKRLTWHF